mgnify:CR=1 FL=1
MRHLITAIGWASFLLCWSLTGRRQTLCAYAWERQDRRFWRAWVLFWDWALIRRHPCGHCKHEHEVYHDDAI